MLGREIINKRKAIRNIQVIKVSKKAHYFVNMLLNYKSIKATVSRKLL